MLAAFMLFLPETFYQNAQLTSYRDGYKGAWWIVLILCSVFSLEEYGRLFVGRYIGERDRKRETRAAQDKLDRLEENTVVVRGLRYEKRPDGGGPMGMPYCERCEKIDRVLIRLAGVRGNDGYKAICPQCKSDFGMEHGYIYPEDRPG
jgi:hypothetical protein